MSINKKNRRLLNMSLQTHHHIRRQIEDLIRYFQIFRMNHICPSDPVPVSRLTFI